MSARFEKPPYTEFIKPIDPLNWHIDNKPIAPAFLVLAMADREVVFDIEAI